MTSTTTNLLEVLNDLIHINYDRIEGYRKAAQPAIDKEECDEQFTVIEKPLSYEKVDMSLSLK